MTKQRVGAESYREVINYLHNELGISKKDVEVWVREAIMEVAENYVRSRMSATTFDNAILAAVKEAADGNQGWFGGSFDADMRNRVAKIIADDMKIEFR